MYDNGSRIVETYTTPDGHVEKCVTDMGYVPGQTMVGPGGVIFYPGYRVPLERNCISNKKQSFTQSESTESVVAYKRLENLLGIRAKSISRLVSFASEGDLGKVLRHELALKYHFDKKEFDVANELISSSGDISASEIESNPVIQALSQELSEDIHKLITAARFIAAAMQIENDQRQGINRSKFIQDT